MSTAAINKVDMSLDDIIKINKVEKKQKARLQVGRGAQSTRGRGGRGRGTGRGRGRGGAVAVTAVRGRGARGRGALTASVRGRGGRGGRQQLQLNSATTRGKPQQMGRGRGNSFRGRGQNQRARGSGVGSQSNRGGFQSGVQLFTRSGLNKQTAAQQQNQRLNKARKQAALLREKQLALKNLQQAQKNMQTVTLALQKSNRDATFNQRRGLGTVDLQTATTNGRGRRKLLANLGRNSNLNNSNNFISSGSGSGRQLNYTSVTISNPVALHQTQSQRGRRRPWNKPRVTPAAASPFQIKVTNESPLSPPVAQPPQQHQTSVLEKLKSLKPAVPTTYKFQKNVFSAPTTGLSLSERFSGTSSSSSTSSSLEERKVFV